jgi:photosystem II stability/assembly factor-like uncharacterized protein
VLGILLGVDDGILELLPGADPERAFTSGRVTSLDYRDGVAIAGVPGEGAWVHDGKRWQRRLDGDVRTVRVGPDGRLFAGTEPPDVHVSTDRGATWEELHSLTFVWKHNQFPAPAGHRSPPLSAIAFPRDGVLVGIGGGGVWHSHDGGKSWLRRGEGLDPTVHAVLEHPEERDRMFASTDSGFFRSEDAGFSWVQSLGGLDRSWGCTFAIVPAAPDRLILSVARRAPGVDGAIFRSANGGLTWQRVMLGDEDEWEIAPTVTRVWDSEDTLFVAAGDKVWGSHDGGRAWHPLADGLPQAYALAAAL